MAGMTGQGGSQGDVGLGPTVDGAGPNAHVVRYLEQFFGLDHAPGFAVLLTGSWGAGKSHLVAQVAANAARRGRRVLAVSMYGVSSRGELDAAISLARYPWMAAERGEARPHPGQAVGARVEPVGLPTRVSPPDANGYVFDDVERGSMPVADVLGYVNRLVEREGRKVVLIADEERLRGGVDGETFRLSKEKVIGRTLTVRPDFDAAYDSFVSKLASATTRDFLMDRRGEVRAVYEQSKTGNLRILQQTLWDFERVHAALTDRHRSNVGAMVAMMRLLFAMSFELKTGNIDPEDVFGRSNRMFSGIFNSSKEPGRLRLASARYSGQTMSDTILPDDVLGAVLVDGLVDETAVRQAVEASSWFRAADEPAWRTIWHSIERDDAELEAAVALMMDQFARREFEKTGELLHVFGLMLRLAELGAIGWSSEEAAAQCRSYVDDLRTAGRLEAPKLAIFDDERHGSYAGLGFTGRDQPAFGEVWNYLDAERTAAQRDRFADQSQQLLGLMERDPTEFVRQLGSVTDSTAPFARLPVLAAIDPDVFANALFALQPLRLREVMTGLSGRYDLGALDRDLAEERPWIEAVRSTLMKMASKAPVWTKERIETNVRWALDDRLGRSSGDAGEGVSAADGGEPLETSAPDGG